MNNRRDFYKKLSNNSLKNIKTSRSNTYNRKQDRTYNTYRDNYKKQTYRRDYRANSQRFEEERNKSSFLGTVFLLGCLLFVGIYFVNNTKPELLEQAKEAISTYLPDEIETVLKKITNFTKDESVTIDEKTIKDMEEEIGNKPKK